MHRSAGITGTSTTAKVFKHSGILWAVKNDTNQNPQTGNMYKCDLGGTARQAKWKYTGTPITGSPNIAVSNLSTPARNGTTYTVKWKLPGAFSKATNTRRATDIVVEWFLGIPGNDAKVHKDIANEQMTENAVQLSSFTAQGKTYNRASFYPVTPSRKLSYITCTVRGKNSVGLGTIARSTLNFATPRAPVISAGTINPNTGAVSFTITTNPGADKAERYDTRYIVTVCNTRTGQTFPYLNTQSTSTSIPVTYDPPDYQQLSYGQYIRITVEAWARGFAGDSAHVKNQYTVAFPAQTTITKYTAVRSSTGKATFLIKTNTSEDHPVDQVRLEYLANTTYKKSSDIPGDVQFTPTDIVDDKNSQALTMPVNNLIPDPGNRTWVRVKSYHGIEAVLFRHSEPVALTSLETVPPSAGDDAIKIISSASGDDGKSAVVQLGWNASGTDDSTGTELSWATAEDTWRSTNTPEVYLFDWSDGATTYTDPDTGVTTTYRDSATITVKGLAEGVPVFIRARRYLESTTTTYSAYSNTATVTPNVAPDNVVLDVPTYIARGQSIPFAWTYGGGGTQRAWQLLTNSGTIIASDENAMGSYNLSAARANELAVNGVLTARVAVATGADFVSSETYQISIVDAPTLTVSTSSTLTAQPAGFTAVSNRACSLVAVLTSNGSDGQTVQGVKLQPEGETIWSGALHPEWTASNGSYTSTVPLPSGLDLRDKARYTLTVVAVDDSTGLRSGEANAAFEVAWTHQAIAPGDYVEITPNDYVDAEGLRHQTATIEWDVPNTITDPDTGDTLPGAANTDVIDVYRVTGDNATFIGGNYPIAYSVTDEYAPFGNGLTLFYRLVLRTVDGDTAYSEIDYALPGDAMRFDWPGGMLELPYDISLSDSYAKNKNTRTHLDGETVTRYNPGVTRTGKQTSRLIRVMSQEQVMLLRRLARYAGNAFVRLPDGSAYEACVEVSDLSNDSVFQAVSINTTENTTTAAYMLPIPVSDEETQGGE